MAEMLDISPSYLNLIERNQRALPAALLVRMTDQFDFDPRALAAGEPGGGMDAIRRRLSDPMFADLEIDRHEVEEWLAAAPGGAEAFARAFDRTVRGAGEAAPPSDDPTRLVSREIERWRNHFADLDAAAEALADELRLTNADTHAALVERLRVRHSLSVRILPVDVLPDVLRRLDLHARQLQLSELLDGSSRTFALAAQLAQIEARAEIDALARGAGFADRIAERLFRRHLTNYFAAALIMPYGRFLRACEATQYDIGVLERRFGSSFEQVAHRLTTLNRVGARGLAFFMIRIDRAGQVSKRYAGAGGGLLVDAEDRCPLWRLHHAFDRPGTITAQLVELENSTRWFTLARTVDGHGRRPGAEPSTFSAEFAIGLGVPAEQATGIAFAHGSDYDAAPTPIGLGCRQCIRENCAQRAHPPVNRALIVNDRERGVSPLPFVGD